VPFGYGGATEREGTLASARWKLSLKGRIEGLETTDDYGGKACEREQGLCPVGMVKSKKKTNKKKKKQKKKTKFRNALGHEPKVSTFS